ncbi:MAG: fatty acid desaturase family protein [Actinomycetaceae bacterium]
MSHGTVATPTPIPAGTGAATTGAGPARPVHAAPGTARSGARRGAGERYVSSFTELSKQVKEAGLLDRAHAYYWIKFAILMAVGVGLAAAFVLIGESWWQLAVAAALGLLMTQTAFMGHDAAHRQIFTSPRWNTWASLVLVDLVSGMGYGWWNKKHNRHHSGPNKLGTDPDIEPGPVIWTNEALRTRRTPLGRWFAKVQAYTFYPLISLQGLSMHRAAIVRLFSRERLEHRWVEAAFLTLRLGGHVVLVSAVLPLGMALAFHAVQLLVFGFWLAMSFAPNHIGMPLVPRGTKVDFLTRQVLMSRNISGGRWVDTFMGGLNFQVEHHLFPSMARPNLRRAAPLVREHCARHGIPYTQVTLARAYRDVTAHVHRVGRGATDVWACPLAGQLRTV